MAVQEKSFEEIYKDNYEKILTFLYGISANLSLAEDITQETFIRAFGNYNSLREESKISAWLNKIAYNLFIDHKRKNNTKLISAANEHLTAMLADLKKNITLEAEQKLMSECVQNKLILLPENYRVTLILDTQGYSNREISAILSCSLDNTKIRLHRARKKMKEILGKDCSFYYDERNVLC